MIDKLTPEQESLISVYRDKWFKIALSTERVDREKAAAAIKASYQQYYSPNYVEPEIIFFQSPNQAFAKLSDSGVWDIDFELDISHINCFQNLEEDLWRQVQYQIETTLLEFTLLNPIKQYIYNRIVEIGLIYYDRQQFDDIAAEGEEAWLFHPEEFAGYAGLYDFCISVLNCQCDVELWSAFKSLIENCGWIFDFDGVCYVCDRPTRLCLDAENLLHSEGEAAIEFTDGFSIYAYHGVEIPEKYGRVYPSEWRSQWLLEENNAELKQLLIQRIGSDLI